MLVTVLKLLLLSFAFHFYKNRYPKEYEGYSNQLFEYVQNNESHVCIKTFCKINYIVCNTNIFKAIKNQSK